MSIDWNVPLYTKHGEPRLGQLLPAVIGESRRRVRVGRVKDLEKEELTANQATTWLYDETGCCSVIGQPSDFDLTNRVQS